MELKTHDLLRLKDIDNIISYSPIPDWVATSLRRAPFVVVRRAPLMKETVPIGIRGSTRSERFAAFLPYSNIKERFSPEKLVIDRAWNRCERRIEMPALQVLPQVDHLLQDYPDITWGPGGSAGFELASGVHTVKLSSDLDLIFKQSRGLTVETAREIFKKLSDLPVRVDVQIETSKGAVSLQEYAKGVSPILMKTENGPYLVQLTEICTKDCSF
ncbi:malonate decarboxylase holo-ACP synthase [Scopulibacillus cellulosilyticus]|uniref:Malonate decarboxylase holo-ACP synthase n=1 Tax=Scopulibacillus cellulosilyticus TaxID=2665665 RepID=A0ABW2Q6N6_9BACL